jgi:hypothetical protein
MIRFQNDMEIKKDHACEAMWASLAHNGPLRVEARIVSRGQAIWLIAYGMAWHVPGLPPLPRVASIGMLCSAYIRPKPR